jgi:hypothetical protein
VSDNLNNPTDHEGKDKLVDITWQNYMYRHELFWKSLYRWGSAVIAISVVPYLRPEILNSLGRAIYIFPVLAWILALVAAWHLGAEYWRLKSVGRKLEGLIGEGFFAYPTQNFYDRFFGFSIGWIAVGLFGLGFTVLTILNCVVLHWLRKTPLVHCT